MQDWKPQSVATLFLPDIYGPVFGQSEKVDQLFTKLRNKIEVEINFQQKGFELLGVLDTLFAAAMSSTTPSSCEWSTVTAVIQQWAVVKSDGSHSVYKD